MEDIQQYIKQALEEIRDAIDHGEIDAEEVEKLFLNMIGD